MKVPVILIAALFLLLVREADAGKAFFNAADSISGKAAEVLKGDGMTYVRVEMDGRSTWVALPQTDVTEGTLVVYPAGKEATDFRSAALDRTFDRIVITSAAPEPAALIPPAKTAIQGKAAEILDSGGYTYVNVENDGGKTWVAVPAMKVVPGDRVEFQPGDAMVNFESKSLNRTFDKIIFSAGPTDPPKGPEPEPEKRTVAGKAAEVFDSGGYTYIRVEKEKQSTWVAVPSMKIAKGSKVAFAPGDTMKGFSSKTLNRTFDTIIFSPGLADAAKNRQALNRSPGSGGVADAVTGKISVEKATGDAAYTVADLHRLKAKLDRKKVTVRGTVVKVSSGIMNRNWIHLKDGTGSSKKANDKIVVTSTALPAEGDTVTMTGTLAKDRDFGSGYKYSVIVEKAAITGN